jgi:glycosyltransferase involved in cell wall biosynthesis
MNDYVGSLASAISASAETYLFVPERYFGEIGSSKLFRFPTGKNKQDALKYFLNPFLAWKVWNRILELRPDVIHLVTGEGYPWSLLFLRWAKKSKIPTVVTVHDPEPHPGNFLELLNSILRRYTLRRASKIHIHSKRFINHIVKFHISPNKITVIPHGSIASIYLAHKHENVLREQVVLFFGRIEYYKGIDDLVKIALQLSNKFKFVIAGPGALPSSLRQVIQAHPELFELYNHWLSEAEVAHLFQRASVCILPYKQATQSSLPLLSAAFNVPVVASAIGALIDDVPAVNGLLVPSGDIEAFVKAIQESINRVPHYPSSYEFDALVDDFVALYKEALAECY